MKIFDFLMLKGKTGNMYRNNISKCSNVPPRYSFEPFSFKGDMLYPFTYRLTSFPETSVKCFAQNNTETPQQLHHLSFLSIIYSNLYLSRPFQDME